MYGNEIINDYFRQVADMLYMLSDSSSSDENLIYDSSDNAEDNNLFDRLDREW